MSKLDTAPYKGVRDFYPEDMAIQNYIFDMWHKVAEKFGYEEYTASLLEPTEIYSEKSGEEIVNEQTFTFVDRGGRSVTLRPEMTPTLARMVAARRRELAFPLRWYSIPNCFRYETTQRGRLREHWQLNLDILGVRGVEADIEIIVVAYKILKNFGARDSDFEICLNTHSDKERLEQVIIGLRFSSITNVRVDETLKRGQAYYTGVVFEFFDTNPKNNRSIFGGGRYDDLLSLFSNDSLPAVGIAAGDVTMQDFLETHGLLPKYVSKTKILMAIKDGLDIPQVVDLYKFIGEIQNAGVNVAMDASKRELGDLYKVTKEKAIPFISFVDADDTMVIKNMQTREETSFKKSEVEKIAKFLNQ